jgi:Fe-S cluster assembly protein SufD
MADIMMMKTPAETALANLFAINKGLLPGDAAVREEAFHRFAERGLPHRRVEEWKYTDLRAALREAAPFAPRPDAGEAAEALRAAPGFGEAEAATLVFANGHLVSRAVRPRPPAGRGGGDAARRRPGARAPAARRFEPGRVGSREPGLPAQHRLHDRRRRDPGVRRHGGREAASPALRQLRERRLRHRDPRAGRGGGGRLRTILESHSGPDGVAYQPNDVVEIAVGDRAPTSTSRLTRRRRVALSTLTAKLVAHVSFDTLNVAVVASVARHHVSSPSRARTSRAGIRGATMVKAGKTARRHHPCCRPPPLPHGEEPRAVQDGDRRRGHGVFQGKIIVQPHAQKTTGA